MIFIDFSPHILDRGTGLQNMNKGLLVFVVFLLVCVIIAQFGILGMAVDEPTEEGKKEMAQRLAPLIVSNFIIGMYIYTLITTNKVEMEGPTWSDLANMEGPYKLPKRS